MGSSLQGCLHRSIAADTGEEDFQLVQDVLGQRRGRRVGNVTAQVLDLDEDAVVVAERVGRLRDDEAQVLPGHAGIVFEDEPGRDRERRVRQRDGQPQGSGAHGPAGPGVLHHRGAGVGLGGRRPQVARRREGHARLRQIAQAGQAPTQAGPCLDVVGLLPGGMLESVPRFRPASGGEVLPRLGDRLPHVGLGRGSTSGQEPGGQEGRDRHAAHGSLPHLSITILLERVSSPA
jgi:hypothetical protein